jgi:hypothetical protein
LFNMYLRSLTWFLSFIVLFRIFLHASPVSLSFLFPLRVLHFHSYSSITTSSLFFRSRSQCFKGIIY